MFLAWVRRIPDKWKWSFLLWASIRLVLSLWGWAIWQAGLTNIFPVSRLYYDIQPLARGFWAPILGIWQRWDAIHYMRIAGQGYYTDNLTAFFPLYPLLAGLLSRLAGLSVTPALLWVSNLAFLLALVLLYQIVDEIYGSGRARGAVAAAVLFPTSVFFYAPYPQSLALLLVLCAYQSARHDRWLLAALASLAAGLCHSTVVPLALLLAWEALRSIRQKTDSLRWSLAAVPIFPFLGVSLFLAWRLRSGFPSFPVLLEQVWGRSAIWPWLSLARAPALFDAKFLPASGGINMGLLFLTVILLVWSIRRLPLPLVGYLAVLLISLLCMNIDIEPLCSFSRYLLLAFPIFIGLAIFIRRPAWRLVAVSAGIVLLFYTSALYFMWVWIA